MRLYRIVVRGWVSSVCCVASEGEDGEDRGQPVASLLIASQEGKVRLSHRGSDSLCVQLLRRARSSISRDVIISDE